MRTRYAPCIQGCLSFTKEFLPQEAFRTIHRTSPGSGWSYLLRNMYAQITTKKDTHLPEASPHLVTLRHHANLSPSSTNPSLMFACSAFPGAERPVVECPRPRLRCRLLPPGGFSMVRSASPVACSTTYYSLDLLCAPPPVLCLLFLRPTVRSACGARPAVHSAPLRRALLLAVRSAPCSALYSLRCALLPCGALCPLAVRSTPCGALLPCGALYSLRCALPPCGALCSLAVRSAPLRCALPPCGALCPLAVRPAPSPRRALSQSVVLRRHTLPRSATLCYTFSDGLPFQKLTPSIYVFSHVPRLTDDRKLSRAVM
jgi:hypothetical protein